MSKPRFSVASYSFHGLMGIGQMNIYHYFETVKYRYNLDTADIWNGMLTGFDEDYLKGVRMAMDERDLELVNLCCDKSHIWADSESERELVKKGQMDNLLAAQILGAKTVRMDVGIAGATATDEQIEYCAKRYDELCELAGRFGAKLGPENHWGASTNVVELRKLFQAVKAPNFGLLLHISNWQKSEDTSLEAQMANDREFIDKAFHTHVMYEICVDGERQLPPLAAHDYKGVWGIESHKSTNEYNNVAYQLSNARRILTPCNYERSSKVDEKPDEFGEIMMRKFMG